MEYRKMSSQEKNGELCEYCRATDFLSLTSATPTPQPYPPTTYQVQKHQQLAANLMIISLELK